MPKSRYERRAPKVSAKQSQADSVAKTLMDNADKSDAKGRYSSLFDDDNK